MESNNSDLLEVLRQYRSWLVEHAPSAAKQMKKGLESKAIRAQLEEWAIRQEEPFPFPESFYPLFEIFNGQKGYRLCLLPGVSDTDLGTALGDLSDMNAWRNSSSGSMLLLGGLRGYKSYSTDIEIKKNYWNPLWFPFSRGEQDLNKETICRMLYIDMDPAEEGEVGQIVLDIQRTDNFQIHLERRVVAPSLVEYFSSMVSDMHSGRIVFDAKMGLHRIRSSL